MAKQVAGTKTNKKEYIFAIGRRREAVARVRLYTEPKEDVIYGETTLKKGEMAVNGLPIDTYFSSLTDRTMFAEPLRITNFLNKFVVTARVEGGGKQGQLDAFILGLSRAIAAFDPEKSRAILKKKGLLTRDARIRERRKVGTGGKARRAKQSPKR